MQLFYTPTLSGSPHILDPAESKHAVRVLRLDRHDVIHMVDGLGNLYAGRITDANPNRCQVEITSRTAGYGKRDCYLHLAVAPVKNADRFEWLVEKATEIGVDEITPVLCVRAERRSLKLERLEKVMIAAMKQSLKAYLPRLNPPVALDKLIAAPFDGNRVIAHCHHTERRQLADIITADRSHLVLIGPEGDFTEEEINLALHNGFISVELGKSRLRTETAAIVAVTLANCLTPTGAPFNE